MSQDLGSDGREARMAERARVRWLHENRPEGDWDFSAKECWARHPGACRRCSEPRPWADGDPRWIMWTVCFGPERLTCDCPCHGDEVPMGSLTGDVS